jgi:hypothetical protein
MQKEKTKKTSPRFQPIWIIDSLTVAISAALIVLNPICFPDFLKSNQTWLVIIESLAPAIMATVVLSISLPHEKIYGIERKQFNQLRGGWYYSIAHMLGVFIALSCGFTIAGVFSAQVAVLVLDAITVFYMIYFVVQEMPILTQNDAYIQETLRRNGQHNKNNLYWINAVQYMLLSPNIGIAQTQQAFEKSPEIDNYSFLLDLQNLYFKRILENADILSATHQSEYRGIPVVDATLTALHNLNSILSASPEVFETNLQEAYKSFSSIHELANKYGIQSAIDPDIEDTLHRWFLLYMFADSTGAKTGLFEFCSRMLVSTISNNDLWFFRRLRNAVYCEGFIDEETESYQIFVSIYLSFVINNPQANPNLVNELKIACNEKSSFKGTPGEPWSLKVQGKLRSMPPDKITKLLPSFFRFYRQIPHPIFWFAPPTWAIQTVWVNDFNTFTNESLCDWWVAYVLTNVELGSYLWNSHQKLAIPELNETDTEMLAYRLANKWFPEGKLSIADSPDYSIVFGPSFKLNDDASKTTIAKELVAFKNGYFAEKISHETEATVNPPEGYQKQLIDALAKAFLDLPGSFKDETLSVSSSFGFTEYRRKKDISRIIDAYCAQFPRLIGDRLYMVTDEQTKPSAHLIEPDHLQDLFRTIDEFNPTHRSYLPYLSITDPKLAQKWDSYTSMLPLYDVFSLPLGCFIKGGPLRIRYRIITSHCECRDLREDEIGLIADRDYSVGGGLYCYAGEEGFRVPMPREDVLKYIKRDYWYVSVWFSVALDINDTNVLRVMTKR